MTEQRRIAAILVADVVGYSKLVGRDEAGTLARLQTLRTELIEPSIASIRVVCSRRWAMGFWSSVGGASIKNAEQRYDEGEFSHHYLARVKVHKRTCGDCHSFCAVTFVTGQLKQLHFHCGINSRALIHRMKQSKAAFQTNSALSPKQDGAVPKLI